MSNAIEIEAKALVSQEDYRTLVHLFKDAERYRQTNYYIDSEDGVLAKEGIALRIREKDGIYELTLKTPLSQGLLEKTNIISMNEFAMLRDFNDFPKADIARFLKMLDIDVSLLKILTSLTTERIDIDYQGGLLSIDRNTYSGITDYEVEFEYNNMAEAERILGALLKENSIDVPLSCASKSHRAMATLKK